MRPYYTTPDLRLYVGDVLFDPDVTRHQFDLTEGESDEEAPAGTSTVVAVSPIFISITPLIFIPLSAKSASSDFACSSVRGNPSRIPDVRTGASGL